jgi:hypothetical protein
MASQHSLGIAGGCELEAFDAYVQRSDSGRSWFNLRFRGSRDRFFFTLHNMIGDVPIYQTDDSIRRPVRLVFFNVWLRR